MKNAPCTKAGCNNNNNQACHIGAKVNIISHTDLNRNDFKSLLHPIMPDVAQPAARGAVTNDDIPAAKSPVPIKNLLSVFACY